MAKFIQEFYNFLSFVEGSDITARRPPEKIDEALYFVIVEEFGKWLDHYVKTKKIDEMLGHFKRRADVAMTTGVGNLPPDYQLWRSLRAVHPTVSGKTMKVEVIEDLYWNDRVDRAVGKVSLDRPIAQIEYSKGDTPARKLEVLPVSIATIQLAYFKRPTKPKYAYTVEGTRYVYDDVNSIDIEFSLLNYPSLLYQVGQMVAVNINSGHLYQYMQNRINQGQIK